MRVAATSPGHRTKYPEGDVNNDRKKIAIIDDLEDNRVIMRKVLELDFTVSDYSDGASALQDLPADPPDLLLLDISMPGMDGFQVLERLRANPRLERVVVVAFTAFANADDAHLYTAAGFDHLIGKPVLDIHALRVELRGLMDRLTTAVSRQAAAGLQPYLRMTAA
jgi:CheY-like chemotaxis protein